MGSTPAVIQLGAWTVNCVILYLSSDAAFLRMRIQISRKQEEKELFPWQNYCGNFWDNFQKWILETILLCTAYMKELEWLLLTFVLSLAGPQVHHGLSGRKVCRRSYPGFGKDMGGIWSTDTTHLSSVYGLRPHRFHHCLGKEIKNRNPLCVHGPGPGGPCSKTLAADHGKCKAKCLALKTPQDYGVDIVNVFIEKIP